MGLASALTHGAVMAALASALIVGIMRFNPRLMMRHFPAGVRERLGPLSAGERAVGRLLALALLAILLGGAVVSAMRLQPGAPFFALAANAFTALMVFNLVDWLVLDELWLGRFRPGWVVPKGCEDLDIPFDHRQHARGFAVGTTISLVGALLAAAVAKLLL